MAKTTCWTAAAAACSILIAACGGGGGDPPSGCSHVAAPATGPGDLSHYFPVDVGRSWTYEGRDITYGSPGTLLGTAIVTVGAPGTVNGEPVSIFTSGTTSAEYAVRPVGVYEVSSVSDPPLDQALPLLVLPFPVQVSAPVQVVACQHLPMVEQGQTLDVDLAVSVDVAAIQPTMTVAAGTFTNVAQVDRVADMTVRAGGQSASGTLIVNTFYAPGVGRILERSLMTIRGSTVENTRVELMSYAPLARLSAAAPSLAVASERSTPAAGSPEERLLRVARRLAPSMLGR